MAIARERKIIKSLHAALYPSEVSAVANHIMQASEIAHPNQKMRVSRIQLKNPARRAVKLKIEVISIPSERVFRKELSLTVYSIIGNY